MIGDEGFKEQHEELGRQEVIQPAKNTVEVVHWVALQMIEHHSLAGSGGVAALGGRQPLVTSRFCRATLAEREWRGVELVGGQLLLQGGARVVIGENARRRALDDVAYGVPLAIAISLR